MGVLTYAILLPNPLLLQLFAYLRTSHLFVFYHFYPILPCWEPFLITLSIATAINTRIDSVTLVGIFHFVAKSPSFTVVFASAYLRDLFPWPEISFTSSSKLMFGHDFAVILHSECFLLQICGGIGEVKSIGTGRQML